MAQFRIQVTYIITAESETNALVKLCKARSRFKEDRFLSDMDISEEGAWLKPKAYKSDGQDKPEDDDDV
jgi:hypothetical protein